MPLLLSINVLSVSLQINSLTNPDQSLNDLLNSQAVDAPTKELLTTIRGLIIMQQKTLKKARQETDGLKARSEMVEKILNEVLNEPPVQLHEPPAPFPPLSDN